MGQTMRSGIPILDWKCCKGKEQYTEDEATEQLRLAKLREQSSTLKKYRCAKCRTWHIGHDRK